MSLLNSASLCVTPNGYKASTLYSVIPNTTLGDMDVVRATTATRVNSAGLIESVANNVPRLDYSNGSCPSLLVEPQRTNLVLFSEQINNAYWVKTAATITANATTSPDGTTNADKFAGDNTSGQHILRHGYFATTALATVIYSFYVKADGITKMGYREDAQTGRNGAFNIATKTTIFTTAGDIISFQDSANGYVRVSIQTVVGSVGTLGLQLFLLDSAYTTGNPNSYSSNVSTSEGVFFYGAQVELGSYPTSYIPTTSAAVTRNADVISKTGISSLIGQTEGTIFVEEIYDSSVLNNGGLDDTLISLTDGTSNNLISIFHYGGGIGTVLFFIRLSNVTQVGISSSKPTSGTYKIALAYKNNDVVGYINGVQIGTDTSASIPATSAVVFYDAITTNSATKKVNLNSAVLFPTRLTNAELASLTTL